VDGILTQSKYGMPKTQFKEGYKLFVLAEQDYTRAFPRSSH